MSYFVARETAGTDLTEARTAATVTLLGAGLCILVRLTGTLPRWRWILVAAMAAATALALVLPFTRTFFDLQYPPASVWWVVLGAVVGVAVGIRFVPVTADGEDEPAAPDREAVAAG